MKEISEQLDTHPELALEMIRCDIRNKQAHDELISYMTSGSFLFKHPITKQKLSYEKLYKELISLRNEDPSAFINEAANIVQNIRRIKSTIKSAKEDKRKQLSKNLEKAEVRRKIIEDIIGQ